MADHLRTELVIDALAMAARHYPLTQGAIFHSDRGTQYTSTAFAAATDLLGIRRSVGATGVCFEVSQRRGFHPPLLLVRQPQSVISIGVS
jgi:putative transposase